MKLTFSVVGVTTAVESTFLVGISSDSSESDSDSAISELLGFLGGLRGRFGLDGGVAWKHRYKLHAGLSKIKVARLRVSSARLSLADAWQNRTYAQVDPSGSSQPPIDMKTKVMFQYQLFIV